MLNWLFKRFHKRVMLYAMEVLHKKNLSIVQIVRRANTDYLVSSDGEYRRIGRVTK